VWLLLSSLMSELPEGWERERFDEQNFDGEILRVERLSLSVSG